MKKHSCVPEQLYDELGVLCRPMRLKKPKLLLYYLRLAFSGRHSPPSLGGYHCPTTRHKLDTTHPGPKSKARLRYGNEGATNENATFLRKALDEWVQCAPCGTEILPVCSQVDVIDLLELAQGGGGISCHIHIIRCWFGFMSQVLPTKDIREKWNRCSQFEGSRLVCATLLAIWFCPRGVLCAGS